MQSGAGKKKHSQDKNKKMGKSYFQRGPSTGNLASFKDFSISTFQLSSNCSVGICKNAVLRDKENIDYHLFDGRSKRCAQKVWKLALARKLPRYNNRFCNVVHVITIVLYSCPDL